MTTEVYTVASQCDVTFKNGDRFKAEPHVLTLLGAFLTHEGALAEADRMNTLFPENNYYVQSLQVNV